MSKQMPSDLSLKADHITQENECWRHAGVQLLNMQVLDMITSVRALHCRSGGEALAASEFLKFNSMYLYSIRNVFLDC